METEAKYLVLGNLQSLERKLVDGYPNLRYIGEIDLPAIYYDTLSGKLEKSEAVLRVRDENGQIVGCFKATTEQDRVFIEEEVILTAEDVRKGDWFTKLNHYSQIYKIIGQEEIRPLVKIETRRRVYLLEEKGLKVEIVFDNVTYLDGLAQEERIEVELKEGDMGVFGGFLHKFESQLGEIQEIKQSKYQKAKEILTRLA